MPQLKDGVYEKKPYYYPREVEVQEMKFSYLSSGCTRMVYSSEDETFVCKVPDSFFIPDSFKRKRYFEA